MSDLSLNEAAFAGGLLGGMFATIMAVSLIFYILLIIAGWKVLEKAGEKGWKALIPIYNAYMLYKIVGMKNWFIGILVASFAISFISVLLGQGTQTQNIDASTGAGVFALFLSVGLSFFALAASIIYSLRTSKAFGHGTLFGVGLFFLQSIFLLVLGFGKSKYNKKLVKSWKKANN